VGAQKHTPQCYIFVTGGVLSGLGKGIAAASIGKLLTLGGLNVVPIKCEGYLNIDPGTMNPIEHGEVYVLNDGEEADMDFGHYERMLGVSCRAHWNITMGKVYMSIFERERRGEFLGKTVQLIPHVTDEIKNRWHAIAAETKADIMLIEIGGTVGDIETELFIEAARQMRRDKAPVLYVHLTYVPFPKNIGEPKTKPTQQSIATLREHGITPDIIIARSESAIDEQIKQKISLFCDVAPEAVISGHDVNTIHALPILYAEQGMVNLLRQHVKIPSSVNLSSQKKLVHNIIEPEHEVTIAICGKYTALEDSYASIAEALVHAGAHAKCRVHIRWVDTENITVDGGFIEELRGVDGIIIPGGFGSRGIEGKIAIIAYARTAKIPFLGICYGLQLAVVEFARNVCNLTLANTVEIDAKTPDPVITLLEEQKHVKDKGGSMRLGSWTAMLKKGTVVHKLYGQEQVSERHRHRYEVNPLYHKRLEDGGMVFSGMSADRTLVEFIELAGHPFFVATQSHPELNSRLERPAPLFVGLVKSALAKVEEQGIVVTS